MKLVARTILFLVLLAPHGAMAGTPLFNENHATGGWSGFGSGFQDMSAQMDAREVQIQVNWAMAGWGLGIRYTLPELVGERKIKALRAKIRTANGSKTKVYIGLSTDDDATIELDAVKALEVSDEWQIFEIPVFDMKVVQTEANTRSFSDLDMARVRTVKFLFRPPMDKQIEVDTIHLRNAEILFNE